jgi:hypothetical protein
LRRRAFAVYFNVSAMSISCMCLQEFYRRPAHEVYAYRAHAELIPSSPQWHRAQDADRCWRYMHSVDLSSSLNNNTVNKQPTPHKPCLQHAKRTPPTIPSRTHPYGIPPLRRRTFAPPLLRLHLITPSAQTQAQPHHDPVNNKQISSRLHYRASPRVDAQRLRSRKTSWPMK